MQQAQGVVSVLSEKPFADRKTGRQIVLHSFQLEGQNMWYRTGTAPIPAGQGQAISFMYNPQNMQVDVGTVQAMQGAPAPAQQPPQQQYGGQQQRGGQAPQRGGARGGNAREAYWEDKEKRDIERQEHYHNVEVPRISFSAAQDRAVNLVSAALQADAISFGNAQKGKRLDMLLDFVDQVADRFFLNSMYAQDRLKALENESIDALAAGVDISAEDNEAVGGNSWEE